MACAFIVTSGAGLAQRADAEVTMPSMKYAAATRFSSAEDARFQLVSAGIESGDDCDPLPLAASATAARGNDVLVLAKAETERRSDKSPPAARTGKSTKNDPGASLIDAVAAAPAAIGVSSDGSRDWEIIVADKTLNATMARWAASAGWQLLWELPVDYAVEARTRVHGTFEEAVSIVARSMESAEIPMKAVFYQGNKVLRIMAKGSE